MLRSLLYVPGDRRDMIEKAFTSTADAVVLDLEDAVPPERKEAARRIVADVVSSRPAWVRINGTDTPFWLADLEAVATRASGIRVPKVETADDARRVIEYAAGRPVHCIIETARGVVAAGEIASVTGVTCLGLGGADLARDLGCVPGELELLYVRSQLVLASRAAGIDAPVDSAYLRISDLKGLQQEAEFSRRLGFTSKTAVHPRQVGVINEVFSPAESELEWARSAVAAFEAAGGAPTTAADGSMVDLAVAERARHLLDRGRMTR